MPINNPTPAIRPPRAKDDPLAGPLREQGEGTIIEPPAPPAGSLELPNREVYNRQGGNLPQGSAPRFIGGDVTGERGGQGGMRGLTSLPGQTGQVGDGYTMYNRQGGGTPGGGNPEQGQVGPNGMAGQIELLNKMRDQEQGDAGGPMGGLGAEDDGPEWQVNQDPQLINQQGVPPQNSGDPTGEQNPFEVPTAGEGVGDEVSGAADQVPTYDTPEGGLQGGDVADDLSDLAGEAMANPSRWDIDMVRQGMGVIDRDLSEKREDAVAGLDEFNASRGRTGSSFEGQDRRELTEDLEGQRMQRLWDLSESMAATQAGDRESAARIGEQAGRFERDLGLDVMNEERYKSEFLRLTTEDARRYGLDVRALDQREQEIANEYEMAGRRIGLDEARLLAENEQFRAGMAQREDEFAREFGLEGQRFAADQEQFAAEFGERVAGRLQQDEQFAATLEQEDARMALDSGIRNRALDLQRDGMDMEEAFRRAELDVEEAMRQRALDLEEQAWAATTRTGARCSSRKTPGCRKISGSRRRGSTRRAG